MSSRPRLGLLLLMLLACRPSGPRGPAPGRALAPGEVGALMYLGVELPEPGAVIGGHFGGRAFDVRQNSYQMTESMRAGWSRAARLRGEAVLHNAGFLVRAVGGPTSDLDLIDEEVRFGVQGRVRTMDVRTFDGTTGRAEGRAEIAWELIDVARGDVIFGRVVDATVRGRDRPEDVVFDVFDAALGRLLADSGFQRALRTPLTPLETFGRGPLAVLPPPEQPILLDSSDLNPSDDSAAIARVAAGLVSLRGPDGVTGTAFLLTGSGLALTSTRVVRRGRRYEARLASGVVRPARLVRRDDGLDVALIQVACPLRCVTVDWDATHLPAVNADVVALGAAPTDGEAPRVTRAVIGGRWGLAQGVTLETNIEEMLTGGEPIALASSGRVVGMVSAVPGRRSANLLAAVLRALRVVPPGAQR